MIVVGFAGSLLGENPSTVLLKDGEILGAIEEERLSREKHRKGILPTLSIRHLLDYHGIAEEEIDEFAYYWNQKPYLFRFPLTTLRYAREGSTGTAISSAFNKLVSGLGYIKAPKMHIAAQLRSRPVPPIHMVDHHVAHAASAHLPSPFDTSASAVFDGSGGYPSTTLYHYEGTRLEKLWQMNHPHSLGHAYAAVTEYLGFHCMADEWKVMGLAPYGSEDPKLKALFEEMIVLEPEGRYRVDPKLARWAVTYAALPMFTEEGCKRLGAPAREYGFEPGDREADIALNFQNRIEEAMFHVLRHLQKRTGEKNLTLSGGVALNCKANGKILENTDFENVWLQPASADDGSALGAALYRWQEITGGRGERWRMKDPYLGPEYSEDEIRRELDHSLLHYERVDDPSAVAAGMVAEGKVIGWFQGRMEWGPRALGNRSILADPRNPEMKDRVNAAIKFREFFRPFAPAILADRTAEYFERTPPSPFMTFTANIHPEKREELGAVCHEDGTGRLQTVERESNPLYYDLIDSFGKLTGTPVVMNTSFNIKGEPIVCRPLEAIRCFCATGLDALVIGPFLLQKGRL